MKIFQTTCRFIYGAGVDAPVKLTSTVEGASLLNSLALSTLSVTQHYCNKASVILPSCDTMVRVLDGGKDVFGLLITPKRWMDLASTVKNNQLCTIKGFSKVSDCVAKTAGMALTLGKLGSSAVAYCLPLDRNDLGELARETGSFETTTSLLKDCKKQFTVCASVLRIADASYTFYQRTYHPALGEGVSPKVEREQTHAKQLFALQCARECSTLASIYIDHTMMNDVVLLGACSTLILIANQLFSIYVIEAQTIHYPKSLCSSSSPQVVD